DTSASWWSCRPDGDVPFTDLESSTRLWEEGPEAMSDALARHDDILRNAIVELPRGGDRPPTNRARVFLSIPMRQRRSGSRRRTLAWSLGASGVADTVRSVSFTREGHACRDGHAH